MNNENTGANKDGAGGEKLFSSFLFLKLDQSFRKLVSNEKISLKQEFENITGSCQEKLFLRTYSLLGLRADCDMLFWRVSPDVETIQHNTARMLSTGIGKYLLPVHSFLGIFTVPEQMKMRERECGLVPKELFGKYKFMLLHPILRSHSWHSLSVSDKKAMSDERAKVLTRYNRVIEQFFYSYGLDDQEMLVIREAEKLEDLAMASKELREQRIKSYTLRDTPALLCVGTDLRDILDSLG